MDINFNDELKNTDELSENFNELERQGMRDILRYYDRIHDKLFSFNNMLIAGYFVIYVVFKKNVENIFLDYLRSQ